MGWGAGKMFQVEHEIHKRRFGRNLGLGLTLAAFVGVVFVLTVVKVLRTDTVHAYEQTVHPDAAKGATE